MLYWWIIPDAEAKTFDVVLMHPRSCRVVDLPPRLDRSCMMTSVLNNPIVNSTSALSSASPSDPIDPVIPGLVLASEGVQSANPSQRHATTRNRDSVLLTPPSLPNSRSPQPQKAFQSELVLSYRGHH